MLQICPTSLNVISHECAIEMIQAALRKGYKLTHVYIDTVGVPEHYVQKLDSRFAGVTPKIKFTVEPKADANYSVVSAASIAAKVTRDRLIEEWSATLHSKGEDAEKTGSGYPSDPMTKVWMQKNVQKLFGYSNMVRFSWETCKVILDTHAVEVKWYFFNLLKTKGQRMK